MILTAILMADVAVLCYLGNAFWWRTVESSDCPNPKAE